MVIFCKLYVSLITPSYKSIREIIACLRAVTSTDELLLDVLTPQLASSTNQLGECEVTNVELGRSCTSKEIIQTITNYRPTKKERVVVVRPIGRERGEQRKRGKLAGRLTFGGNEAALELTSHVASRPSKAQFWRELLTLRRASIKIENDIVPSGIIE